MPKPIHQKPKRDHYAEVTDQIIAEMEKGQLTWRQPWDIGNAFAGGTAKDYMPRNAVSGRAYSGINKLVLMMSPMTLGSMDPRWATYQQAQEKDWQVRAGSRGTKVFFYKSIRLAGNDAAGDDPDLVDGQREAKQSLLGSAAGAGAMEEAGRTIPVLRSYTIFHASQIEGIPPYEPGALLEQDWSPDEIAEHVVQSTGVVVDHNCQSPFYSPTRDSIGMPPKASYETATAYYSDLLHEVGHWTGHPSRLARPMDGKFGTPSYAAEELRAELTSVFLGAATGIEPSINEAAAYLQHWSKLLRDNKKEIFRAAADAQRASDYVLALAGMQPEVDMDFDADAVTVPVAAANDQDLGQLEMGRGTTRARMR